MNCEQIMRSEVAEKYLLGQLSEAEQKAFEQHYFECQRCFDDLQTYRALQLELKHAAPAIRAEPAATRIGWKWASAAAAAVVTLAVGIGVWFRQPATVPSSPPAPVVQAPKVQTPTEPPLPTLQELAQVQPPPYVPASLRGPEDEARRQFRQAMRHYMKGEFQAAIHGLRSAYELDDQLPDVSFFLGVCYLLTEQTDSAIDLLRRTIGLGESPYLEEAHFYLSKAYLRKGDVLAATNELKATIRLQGSMQSDARDLLHTLEKLKTRSP